MNETDTPDSTTDHRVGNIYLDEHGNVYVIDGAHHGGDEWNEITHYHWVCIGDGGITTTAAEEWPRDDDTSWVTVSELNEKVEDGTLRPAEVTEIDD